MMRYHNDVISRHFSSEEGSIESSLPTTHISLTVEDESVGVGSRDGEDQDIFNSHPPTKHVIEELVDELRVPEHFIDPLDSHLMKDPVVLSTGFVVDRETVLGKDGSIYFKICPFTGKELNSIVYPLEEKKKQIKDFRKRRDENVTKLVRALIAEGKSFQNILDDTEVYLKKTNENYLSFTRDLSEIWVGSYREVAATTILVEHLRIKDGNTWMTAAESGPVEDEIYKILVSAEIFKDKGKGSHRSFLALSLYDNEGQLVERSKLFKDPHSGKGNPYCSFGKKDLIVTNARAGYSYKLEYMIGSSPKYVQVEGLICKIFPMCESVSSFRMRDADGEDGLYIGQIDTKRNAHGKGSLEYDDGKRFVGMFRGGAMIDGVLYRGPAIRYTLKRGKWTRLIDGVLVEKYPSNMLVYDESGFLVTEPKRMQRTEATDNGGRVDDLYSQRKKYTQHDDLYELLQKRHYTKRGPFDESEAPFSSRNKASIYDDERRWGDREFHDRKSSASPNRPSRFIMNDDNAFSRSPHYYRRAYADDLQDVDEGARYEYHDKKKSTEYGPKSILRSTHYGMDVRDDMPQSRPSRYDPLEHDRF
mmetsp:Transcript_11900/g.15025  ORF Transcript_11900/g.15025 Transcript_11900/m.15025 type:complete len:588 (+) Transcript_11900:70-1833(+)